MRDALQVELLAATLEVLEAAETFKVLTRDIPGDLPRPDGTQSIINAFHKVEAARDGMMKAHRRVSEFIEHGIVPKDLKRSR
jgi:hypothetical protein